jgi:hypothetical protein
VKKHMVWVSIIALLLLGRSAVAQDAPTESPLMDMLHFVPDTPNNRQWLSYGDLATWHKSWNVPRIGSFDELKGLTPDQRAAWLNIAAEQTDIPSVLGPNYLATDDLQGFDGFDVFTVDRFLQAGNPPDGITLVDFSFDRSHIAETLTASGYAAQPLEQGGTLYSILDDYGLDMSMKTVKTRTGQLGDLNRIALLDGRMVIGKATEPVTQALSASQGETPSLADDPSYTAAVKSLNDPALADTGDLVGVVFVDYAMVDQQQEILTLPPDVVNQIMQGYVAAPLPAYQLAAFATRHGSGATHLILEVVFPEETDAKAAANTLADRMKSYISLQTRQPLTDRWTFELATGTKIGGLPTALVVMKVDDHAPIGQDSAPVRVFSWIRMLSARDTLFLISQP